MNAGKLTQQITIQQRTGAADSWGQPSSSWATYATEWADIRSLGGLGVIRAERQAGDKEVSSSAYSMRIRYRTDITAKMRVQHEGQIYDIRQVVVDLAHRRYVDLVCEVGASEG